MADALREPLALSPNQLEELVTKRVTCPFLGSAIAMGKLDVLNLLNRPLASIDAVAELGNRGNGTLGEVLRIFAEGNHGSMPGPTGKLDQKVPEVGLFSLDLPGSQGSHPGHSGILQGNPDEPASGRFSEDAFKRLTNFARDGKIKRSDIGKFIAENVKRDPRAKFFDLRELLRRVPAIIEHAPPAGFEKFEDLIGIKTDGMDERMLVKEITGLARVDNLVGSAGEFALLFAFLENKPDAPKLDGEPAVSVEDLTLMFKEKTLPQGWESWPKTMLSWLTNTFALAFAAHAALL